MLAAIAIIVLTAASFVAGAVYGRNVEAKAIAYEIRVVAAYHADVAKVIDVFRSRIRALRAHL